MYLSLKRLEKILNEVIDFILCQRKEFECELQVWLVSYDSVIEEVALRWFDYIHILAIVHGENYGFAALFSQYVTEYGLLIGVQT